MKYYRHKVETNYKKNYAGDDAQWLYHGNNPAQQQVSPNTQNLHTLVFETAEPDDQYGYNGNENINEDNIEIKPKKSDRKIKKRLKKKIRNHRHVKGGIQVVVCRVDIVLMRMT
eukprot:TRINITY_DN404_c0_g1_i1.p1 TRINITY_DN404_c0_g1~~TRINITY_DN404_c0_g1_i1.p1  ORF type:complete len:114 (+),score=12.07 TRINITY_DN404_c0_g1_i1:69-410(+)